VGVIVLRIKQPKAERPFKVMGYPLLPGFFALFCLTLVIVTIIQKPAQSLTGLFLISLGIPVYLYYLKRK
jgi:basic amino acid/polyamine antiporter, APA family